MIGCLWTRVRKQPIIALYFESENELELYNLEARTQGADQTAWMCKLVLTFVVRMQQSYYSESILFLDFNIRILGLLK